ncbi:phage tail tape measure protein [Paraburkholderia fungorum]|uniref:phage tail tape measure protein n=1 Tax=Paraburkholderia fungorum TaxID=134537 RepID=UPI00402BCCC8
MEQGVAVGSVLNGGLKAAANMSVVLRVPAEEAGEMAAKLREAYKLSDNELTKMADSMQRAKFAFGMKPSDLMAASSYQAPMLNQLGITGLGNTNKMLAIQGMAAQVGLEGSSFGTNFSMMLSRLAKGPMMVEAAKKGMKAEARHVMEKAGIKFDFFDKKGNFAGLDHMVKELEKLKTIKEKLGDKAAMEVAEAMFGAEAGRPAMILAEQGMKGFEEAQKKMADQASLDDRIKKTLESTRNTWESLTGSIENFGAAAAGPAVRALHPLINGLNEAAGAMTAFGKAPYCREMDWPRRRIADRRDRCAAQSRHCPVGGALCVDRREAAAWHDESGQWRSMAWPHPGRRTGERTAHRGSGDFLRRTGADHEPDWSGCHGDRRRCISDLP